MKLLIMLLSLVSLSCLAGEALDITTKVTERDRDKDGKVDARNESTFRNGKRVMFVQSRRNTNDVLVVTARSFWVAGELVMTEIDEDGDGLFEHFVIYRAGSKELEAFFRQADGTVKPASANVLRGYKQMDEAFDEFWDKAMDKDFDPDKLEGLMQETQGKIRDAGRKTEEKK